MLACYPMIRVFSLNSVKLFVKDKNEAENEIEEVSEILNKSGNGNKISNQIEEIEIESPDLSPAPVVDEPEEQIDEVLSEVEEIFSTANSGNVTAKDVLNEK